VADAAGGGAEVGAERWLTIRSRRHEVVRSAAQETGAEADGCMLKGPAAAFHSAIDRGALVFERSRS
jgi:hypothetical protein